MAEFATALKYKGCIAWIKPPESRTLWPQESRFPEHLCPGHWANSLSFGPAKAKGFTSVCQDTAHNWLPNKTFERLKTV